MKVFRALSWVGFAEKLHGTKVPLDELNRLRQDEKELIAANAAVVRGLQAGGISCRRLNGDRICTTHTVTDAETEIDQWRNNNLLPAVQVRKRRLDVVVLEGYCAQLTWGLRMRLVTSGERCRVEGVGERIEFIHETVRRLQERAWFRKRAELISIGIEFTAEPGPDGELLYHVHAHLIYRVLKHIPKDEFRDFLRRWKGHFKGRFCRDSGRIRDIREACKYPCKAADLLVVLGKNELPALYEQLKGRKLFQTYGGLRALRADLRATGHKLKRRRLAARTDEAVANPQKPLIEYVRVGAQPRTRVRYGKRRYSGNKPTDVFLGWTSPAIDTKTGQVGVQEVWLNPTRPPEERRRLRNLPRWTPALWRQALSDEGGALQVHTDTSSACPEDPKMPPADVVENCLFPVGPDWTDDNVQPPLSEPYTPLDDLGIPVIEIDPEDLQ